MKPISVFQRVASLFSSSFAQWRRVSTLPLLPLPSRPLHRPVWKLHNLQSSLALLHSCLLHQPAHASRLDLHPSTDSTSVTPSTPSTTFQLACQPLIPPTRSAILDALAATPTTSTIFHVLQDAATPLVLVLLHIPSLASKSDNAVHTALPAQDLPTTRSPMTLATTPPTLPRLQISDVVLNSLRTCVDDKASSQLSRRLLLLRETLASVFQARPTSSRASASTWTANTRFQATTKRGDSQTYTLQIGYSYHHRSSTAYSDFFPTTTACNRRRFRLNLRARTPSPRPLFATQKYSRALLLPKNPFPCDRKGLCLCSLQNHGRERIVPPTQQRDI